MKTTFRLETIKILKRNKRPMQCIDITKEILKGGNVRIKSITPNASLYTILTGEIKKKGIKSAFVRTEEGLFALNKK